MNPVEYEAQGYVPCDACKGTGVGTRTPDGFWASDCDTCHGTGWVFPEDAVMNEDRLRELAWEAVDGEQPSVAIILSPAEVAWLLSRFAQGRKILKQARKEHAP